MDTGAISHMPNNPGILTSSSPPPLNTSIIVGNGTTLVNHIRSSICRTELAPLSLHNVLIFPHLIKNLISFRALTHDNWVSATFDPFGFSIKDFRTEMNLLQCDSTGDLYPLCSSTNKGGYNLLRCTPPSCGMHNLDTQVMASFIAS
jgi:hypothetical protein